MGQGVEDRVVRALFQHGCKDDLLVALSTANDRKKRGANHCMCGRVVVNQHADLLMMNSHLHIHVKYLSENSDEAAVHNR